MTNHQSEFMETSPYNKQRKKKIVLTSIAVGAAGVLGYFGWTYWNKRKQNKTANLFHVSQNNTAGSRMIDTPNTSPATETNQPAKTFTPFSSRTAAPSRTPKDNFPLKKGNKRTKVKLSEKVDISELGNDLYNATITRDFNKVLLLLKMMNNTFDYAKANQVFQTNRINGVRQTIVNALLHTFTSKDQQQKIKYEFLRMGLQFNGSKWSLSGLGGLPIITTVPATIWINAQRQVEVPAQVVLGNEVSKRLDYTLFENQGRYFLVPTRSVQYLY